MYDAEIAIIKRDLGIEDVKIWWTFHHTKTLTVDGERCGAYHRPGENDEADIIEVATNAPYKEVVISIAHELRHAAQFAKGILTVTWERGGQWRYTWAGTQFCQAHRPYTQDTPRYSNRPEERDARAYSYDCWERLFKGSTKVAETPSVILAGMFD